MCRVVVGLTVIVCLVDVVGLKIHSSFTVRFESCKEPSRKVCRSIVNNLA